MKTKLLTEQRWPSSPGPPAPKAGAAAPMSSQSRAESAGSSWASLSWEHLPCGSFLRSPKLWVLLLTPMPKASPVALKEPFTKHLGRKLGFQIPFRMRMGATDVRP